MKIIISPAKQMIEDSDSIAAETTPVFLDKANEILEYLKDKNYEELKSLWKCNDKIASLNFERIKYMELEKALTPAIISYDGIAFKYMAPNVFENNEFDYVQENLRILSGFYGVLKPLDSVTPYRLEMQSKAKVKETKNLYEYWGNNLYNEVIDDSRIIINLASKEYSKAIEKYLKEYDTFITCIFGELIGEKVVQKGVYAKMARGEMVRFMASNNIESIDELKNFNLLGYSFSEERSDEKTYIFLK